MQKTEKIIFVAPTPDGHSVEFGRGNPDLEGSPASQAFAHVVETTPAQGEKIIGNLDEAARTVGLPVTRNNGAQVLNEAVRLAAKPGPE
jgi:hypothetical protein